MKYKSLPLNMILLLAFVISACGSAAPDAMADKPVEESATPHDATAPDVIDKPTQEAMVESPAWFSASLTDANTGQNFTINDFKGKVVLVEMMAVWCPKCYTQQEQIQSLHGLVGDRDDFVSISLDIDPNEDAGILQQYVQQTGFTWKYAIASQDIAREIASLYGDQFLNPPSTPILVIDRKGVAHPLPFGIKSAQDLMNFIQPLLDESI